MKSKIVSAIEELNKYLSAGWRVVRAYEEDGKVKFHIVKDMEK